MTEMPGADPFVAQLADLCRAHPTRTKWVIVSSHAVGDALGERLAREGTNWANLRFKTPSTWRLKSPRRSWSSAGSIRSGTSSVPP